LGKLKIILPGLLVAATGVGAGDLITASLGGSQVGLVLLWAPIVGALMKLVLTEGLTRYQIATGKTLLEGWLTDLGSWIQWVFFIYLMMWTYMVGGALINASAAAALGLLGMKGSLGINLLLGTLHSVVAYILVLKGSFKLFEKIMSILIALMFMVVIFGSLFFIMEPSVKSVGFRESFSGNNLNWVIGVLGGVGGTLTILSYGYWIREAGREGKEGLKTSRIDLGVAYFLTALFSMGMIVLGNGLIFIGSKAMLPQLIAAKFIQVMGPAGKWIFLGGFWAGVYSSLLGVWQGVPYIYADFVFTRNQNKQENLRKTFPYKMYLTALAFIPLTSLLVKFESIQMAYAVVGAFFMPLLALSLLLLNNKLDENYRNRWASNTILILTLLFFLFMGVSKLLK
jgi:Mn2+/Fe2+ NRAMP family transporter